MAPDPEAQAQLARLLDDESLRFAAPDAIRSAVDDGFERLVDGMLEEAAASDDVSDRETALAFVAARLQFFAGLIDGHQSTRLWLALRDKIEAW